MAHTVLSMPQMRYNRQLGGYVPHQHRRYHAICEQCGQPFTYARHQTRGRFCSRSCWGHWLANHARGAMSPNFGRHFGRPKHLPPATYVACGSCGQPFRIKPSHADRRRFCSKACAGRAHWHGAANPRWVGGREPYYGPSWRSAQRAVRLRDPICQRCCILPETNGKALDVHHLIPFRTFGVARHAEANALSNLIALCHNCHLLVEWDTNRRAPQPVS